MQQQTLQALGFIELTKVNKNFIIQLPYATPDNFTGKQIYPSDAKAYLRVPVANALSAANHAFAQQGLTLKIWDAYRPFSAQEQLWQVMPVAGYVAKPVRIGDKLISGSVHNRGGAVDITLAFQTTGMELLMPTAYDHFSERAHRNYMQLSVEQIQHRELLESVMQAHGFIGLATEWWHFDWQASDAFELCDIPI
jgi:zinc D-Ala-D-Ala dipeptidase